MEQPDPAKRETEIPCSYCVQSKVPATKTCLHCEASMCEEHLKAHSKSTEHVLVEPTTSIKDMKCSIHDKLIEFCCSEDGACICVSCCIVGEHRGHKVDPLKDAFEKRMASLQDVIDKLTAESQENEKKLERLQTKQQEVHQAVAGVTERVAALFRDMTEQLNVLQTSATSEVSRQEQQALFRVNGLIQQLEKKKVELSKKISSIQGLRNVTDPLTVLRGTSTEERGRRDSRKISDGDSSVHVDGSVDEGSVSLILHMGLLSFAESLLDLMAIRQFSDVKKTDLRLDVNTAHGKIVISSDLKSASHSATSQKYPETPERFKSCQVLSTNLLSSGQHYWEVDVSGAKKWIVGVAYRSIERKIAGNESFIGYNSKSWTLFFQKFLGTSHNNVQYTVACSSPIQAVGVHLNYDAGYLSFYQLSPTRHLYTFTATFTEPLHAAFYIFESSCIKLKS
ncbi:E3 ubiquitin/ISG15 ligase TRIM25-like [Pseudophryne corroboree]|uniref:E3 ubiquitin/ISG15 ligase TRIM25-like n=1 Tax=Pseudophryne corroboree TaxID=495146 RepID=UPI0030816DD8